MTSERELTAIHEVGHCWIAVNTVINLCHHHTSSHFI